MLLAANWSFGQRDHAEKANEYSHIGLSFQIENRTQILYSICKKVLDSLGDRD